MARSCRQIPHGAPAHRRKRIPLITRRWLAQRPSRCADLGRCGFSWANFVAARGSAGFAGSDRDYETHSHRSEAVIHVAVIVLMSRRLTRESTLNWRGT